MRDRKKVKKSSGCEIRSTDLLHKLGWQSLEESWREEKAMLMYNLINYFDKRKNNHEHNTRSCHINLSIPQPKTSLLKHSLTYSGAVARNSLTLDVKE